jgi:GxxExxY protein
MLLESELCYRVQGCIYEVYRQLGHGYLEKVYERALCRELELQGLNAECQVPLTVSYKGIAIGEYFADMVIEDAILVELKAQEPNAKAWDAQLINYLKASGLQIGLLVNFTYPKATVRRLVI